MRGDGRGWKHGGGCTCAASGVHNAADARGELRATRSVAAFQRTSKLASKTSQSVSKQLIQTDSSVLFAAAMAMEEGDQVMADATAPSSEFPTASKGKGKAQGEVESEVDLLPW